MSIFVLLSVISRKTAFYKFLDWLDGLSVKKEYLYNNDKFFNKNFIAISPFLGPSKYSYLVYRIWTEFFISYEEFRKKLNAFINRISNFLELEVKEIRENKEDKREKIEKSFYEEFMSLYKLFKEQYDSGNIMFFLPLIKLSRILLFEKIHDNCIVFQNANECKKNILFCADASKKLISHIIQSNLLYNSYELIKLPHHGTEPYSFVVSNLSCLKHFSSKCYFISNDNSIKKWSISPKVLNPSCNNNPSIATCDVSKNILGSLNYTFCLNKCFCVNI